MTGKPQQAIDAYHVRINCDARDPKSIAQNHIGCFPSHPRNRHEIFHPGGDLPAKFFDDHFRGAKNTLGFMPVKTRATDGLFDLLGLCRKKSPHIRVFFKKTWSDPVYELVRTLGRKNRRDQKFPRR